MRSRIQALFLGRVLPYFGVMLVVVGLLFIGFMWFGVALTQSDCQGGNSPVPNQGCGYVPYMVLYERGSGPPLLFPAAAIFGGIILFVRALAILVMDRSRRVFWSRQIAFGATCLLVALVVAGESENASVQIYEQQQPLVQAADQIQGQCPLSWPTGYPPANTNLQLEPISVLTLLPGSQSKICVSFVPQRSGTAVVQSLNATVSAESNFSQKIPASLVQAIVAPATLYNSCVAR